MGEGVFGGLKAWPVVKGFGRSNVRVMLLALAWYGVYILRIGPNHQHPRISVKPKPTWSAAPRELELWKFEAIVLGVLLLVAAFRRSTGGKGWSGSTPVRTLPVPT